jgi:hypothetical protein
MTRGELLLLLLDHLLGGGELLLAFLVLGVALADALVDRPFERAGVVERGVELDRLVDVRGGRFEIVALEGRACVGEHFDRLLMIERAARAVDQRMGTPVVGSSSSAWSQASTAVPNSPASKAVCACFRYSSIRSARRLEISSRSVDGRGVRGASCGGGARIVSLSRPAGR